MKELIKRTSFWMGRLYAAVFPPSLCNALKSVSSYLYTGYHSHRFQKWGKGSVMVWGVRIIHPEDIAVGEDTELLREVSLTANNISHSDRPVIQIGNHCSIGAKSHITAINGIEIGHHLLTGDNVLITDNAHGSSSREMLNIPPTDRPLVSKGRVKIGDYVWLCDKVAVLPGVTIGNNVIVGVNSVVTADIPDNCVAAGIPAKVVKRIEA